MINEPHIKLNLSLPKECRDELLQIKDYYGLVLNNSIDESTRLRYYKTSLGHAFRSYAPFPEYAYYTKDSKSLFIDEQFDDGTFVRTRSWKKIPKTSQWLVDNLCDEKDLGLVCLHKIIAGGWVDWHSHYPCNLKVVHFSLITNKNDLSEVQVEDKVHALNYPEREAYIFNSYLPHRSTNFSDHDRIHLVVECSPNNEKFQALYHQRYQHLD